jgi:hypothetical protein
MRTACVACDRPNPSGLTKEQAEAVLLEPGYTYLTIGPTPDGWSGYAGARIADDFDRRKERHSTFKP